MIDMPLEIRRCLQGPRYTYERGQRVLHSMFTHNEQSMECSCLGYCSTKGSEQVSKELDTRSIPMTHVWLIKPLRGVKQHTITWHVDDLKSSHVDPKVKDEFHKWLQSECGAVIDVTATRGKKHVCLGMLLDFSTPGQVKVDMTDHARDVIDEFPINLDGNSSDPCK